MKQVKGVILAAGMGKRLRPLTLNCAKPAIPFLNSPLIDYSLELFSRLPVQEIVINLHHAPETVMSAVSSYLDPTKRDLMPQVHFSLEETILGTAGGIGKVRHLLQGNDIIVSNGKIYFEQDLAEALDFHRDSEAWVTMVLVPHSGKEPYNPVLMNEEGLITGFPLRSTVPDFSQAYVFTGVQILSDRVLDFIPEGVSDSVRDVYPALMERERVRGFVSDAYWCENSWTEKYLENSFQVLARMGLRNLCPPEFPEAVDGTIAAQNVQVGDGASLRNTILMQGCRVGTESSLCNVILSPGTQLPPQTVLRDKVVTPLQQSIPEDLLDQVKIEAGYVVWPLT